MNAHNRWDIEYFFARPQDAGRQGDFGEWDVVEWEKSKHENEAQSSTRAHFIFTISK